jgi:ribose transport system ATP-binding protein
MTYVLEAEGIVKSFAGVQALRGVDFRVRTGEIHGLVGHNGAGKSTLVKIVNGVYPSGSYEGTVRLDGEMTAFASPADARSRGVGYVPQETQVLEHLSVAENVFVGQTSLERRGVVLFRDLYARSAELLEQFHVPLDPREPVASLSAAQRQLVMVARALATRPSVLILDEPTTSLAGHETERLFVVLRRLRQHGVTMVLITHRIPEVMELCDRATVLRDGEAVAEFGREELHEREIVNAMVGRELNLVFPARTTAAREQEALRVEHLRVPHPTAAVDLIADVSFEVRAGEIVGLAGLVGSGRTEVLSAVYGALAHEGRVWVAGREVRLRRPADARAAGVAMLTEDRKRDGLLFNYAVKQNITIGNLAGLSRRLVVDRRAEEEAARRFIETLRIKTPSLAAAVDHLSGGTQQKLLLARVLMNDPQVLLLDEPTKGVDVETKHEIYRLVVGLADRGVAIVLVSSEIGELLGLADRCLVLAQGLIVDEFARVDGSEERVIEATTTALTARTRAEQVQT